MKKYLLLFCALVTLAAINITPVDAASGFKAGRIIDDAVFTNKSTMSVSDIQTFLNSKVPTCDTNGQQLSEFGGPDLNGDGKVQRWEWGKANYNQTTFPCLKEYTQDGVSAAQLIYNASQTYSINPQIMIVLLQKEQGLITDTWPLNVQYRSATGYGCPDTAACDAQYYGLKNQLNWAATMFRAIMNNSPTWYTPYVLGNNYIQYNPNASCGGSNVNIENRSTQALYNYTPYQPSQAAIDAGWGQVHCGAYGNRNFYLYFTSWFGDIHGGPAYQWSLQSFDVFSDINRTVKINEGNRIYLQPGQVAYGRVTAKNTGANSWTERTFFETTNTPFSYNNDWLAYNRLATSSTYPIATNETATYNFSIKAPSVPGLQLQSFNLHHDDKIWFNNQNSNLYFETIEALPMPQVTDVNRLNPGDIMKNGDIRYSPERHSVLQMNRGEVALYTNFKKVWSTNSLNSGATKFVNQPDGNLVLYTDDGKVVWASNTDNRGASTLSLQIDGNATLYSSGSPIWSTNTSTINQLLRVNSVIKQNQMLTVGQKLSSHDRKSVLLLQTDGNLVLYNPNKQAIWASNTDGSNATKFIMQNDGNLVLYTNSGKVVWASNTDGVPAAAFAMQNDRNLVLYSNGKAIWASNTAGK